MVKVKNGTWSKEETETLRKLFGTKTYKQIAEQIGRSTNSVGSKITNLGLVNQSQRALQEERESHKTCKMILNMKFCKGDRYEVEWYHRGAKDSFEGKVIQDTNRHVTLEGDRMRESFLKVDFIIGEAEIREVI